MVISHSASFVLSSFVYEDHETPWEYGKKRDAWRGVGLEEETYFSTGLDRVSKTLAAIPSGCLPRSALVSSAGSSNNGAPRVRVARIRVVKSVNCILLITMACCGDKVYGSVMFAIRMRAEMSNIG
jgi:hypothetical protein